MSWHRRGDRVCSMNWRVVTHGEAYRLCFHDERTVGINNAGIELHILIGRGKVAIPEAIGNHKLRRGITGVYSFSIKTDDKRMAFANVE